MEDRITKARVYYERGQYYYSRGSFQDAVVHFQEALELYPAHILARLHLAASMARLKHHDAALRTLAQGQQENLGPEEHVKLLKLSANICVAMGAYSRARQYLDEATTIDASEPGLLNLVGAVCLKSGEYRKGFDAYLKAIRLS